MRTRDEGKACAATCASYLAGLLLAAWCAAQTGPRAVEQGVGDRHPLSLSQRDAGADLHAPSRFEYLYRLDPRSRLLGGVRGWRGGAFARAQGGLVAVFPYSAYRPVAPGVEQVQIPPGTIFMISDPKSMHLPAPNQSTRESRSLLRRVESVPVVERATREVPEEERVHASIWVSEEYRARRVASLLDKAYRAER